MIYKGQSPSKIKSAMSGKKINQNNEIKIKNLTQVGLITES
jgi:hypothetical protein